MTVHGFQKMTLLDYPGKVACTVFTGGCNLRCPFCHNASLVTAIDTSAVMESDEVVQYLKKRIGLLDGMCVTGGEPTLQKDLPEFLAAVKALGYAVKLDTNGTRPDILRELVNGGLVDYVAMDIKNIPEKYPVTVGIPDFDIAPVQESVAYLLTGAVDFEFRTTVVRQFHSVEDIEGIARWIQGAPRYFLQNFVDSGALIGEGLEAVDAALLRQMRDRAAVYIPATQLRGV